MGIYNKIFFLASLINLLTKHPTRMVDTLFKTLFSAIFKS